MRKIGRHGICLCVLVIIAGCASTKVTSRETMTSGERIARPDHIYIHPFAATAADVDPKAADSVNLSVPSTPPSQKDIELGRKLGGEVATRLAAKIQAMGLPGAVAGAATEPAVGDIVIYGHFASIEEGSTGKRVVLGFGSGTADLVTVVAGYLKTRDGMRKLGSGTIDAGGGKTPGLLLPVAVTVATANPIGLLVGGAVKGYGEISGKDTIEGSAERTASQIATELEKAFKKQGWI